MLAFFFFSPHPLLNWLPYKHSVSNLSTQQHLMIALFSFVLAWVQIWFLWLFFTLKHIRSEAASWNMKMNLFRQWKIKIESMVNFYQLGSFIKKILALDNFRFYFNRHQLEFFRTNEFLFLESRRAAKIFHFVFSFLWVPITRSCSDECFCCWLYFLLDFCCIWISIENYDEKLSFTSLFLIMFNPHFSSLSSTFFLCE